MLIWGFVCCWQEHISSYGIEQHQRQELKGLHHRKESAIDNCIICKEMYRAFEPIDIKTEQQVSRCGTLRNTFSNSWQINKTELIMIFSIPLLATSIFLCHFLRPG